jgi:hypothetical protein
LEATPATAFKGPNSVQPPDLKLQAKLVTLIRKNFRVEELNK